jgi:DNA repair photolyase
MDSTADLDIMSRYPGQCEFGATLTFPNEELRKEWEPGAASHWERVEALHEAKLKGIKTFVSIEPVIDVDQSLEAIRTSGDAVDRYNIGWVNYRGADPNQTALPLLIAAALKTGARVALKRDAWDVLHRIGHPEAAAGCELLFDPTI